MGFASDKTREDLVLEAIWLKDAEPEVWLDVKFIDGKESTNISILYDTLIPKDKIPTPDTPYQDKDLPVLPSTGITPSMTLKLESLSLISGFYLINKRRKRTK